MHKYLRAIQTYVPFLQDARFMLKSYMMKVTRTPHEEDFYALKMFNPATDEVYVDVGVNRGNAILSMLIFSRSDVPIVGFEPNPFLVEFLSKNKLIKSKRVKLHNVGLGDKNGNFTLYIPFYRKWMFDGLSSFHLEAAQEWLVNRLWRFDSRKLSIKEASCEVKILDDFDLNPYFIKLDVQGFELNVLKGARRTLEKSHPILLIESISDDIKEYLSGFGYDFYYFENGKFEEGIGQLNTFCITKERWASLVN